MGNARTSPEIVFGFVGAIGADLEIVEQELKSRLKTVDYETLNIKLTDLIQTIEQFKKVDVSSAYSRYISLMDKGDDFRVRTGLNDAMARLAILSIRTKRKSLEAGQGFVPGLQEVNQQTAYILHSLKTPAEVTLLRKVYGDSFVLIGVYTPNHLRKKRLRDKVLKGRIANAATEQDATNQVNELVSRDEKDSEKKHGQNVSETFELSDIFIDSTDESSYKAALERIVGLLFGNKTFTPTRDEYAMYHAKATALRSSALARQVGAAIANADGTIISMGSNEVPKYGGGQYWPDDIGEERDIRRGYESNDKVIDSSIEEILSRMVTNGWIAEGKQSSSFEELKADLKGTRVASPIEYSRTVHAEMAALMDAARMGLSVNKSTLYTTTFPCHNCARHIVAAGVEKVFYIEPYAKSMVDELHDDSIDSGNKVLLTERDRVKFRPFVGVSPARYYKVFQVKERKGVGGKLATWLEDEAVFEYGELPEKYMFLEYIETQVLNKAMGENGLNFEKEA